MNIELWVTFLIACIILAISPGAGAVNTMSVTMKYGFKRSLVSNFGLQVGNIVNISIAGAGLGALLAQSGSMFSAIKWAGVLYLIYLGIQKFRETNIYYTESDNQNDTGSSRLFTRAVVVNVTNPKSIVFLVALLPQFIEPSGSHFNQMLILGGTMVVVDMTVMIGYAILATRIARLVQSQHHVVIQNRIFGGMFIGAGTLLAVASKN